MKNTLICILFSILSLEGIAQSGSNETIADSPLGGSVLDTATNVFRDPCHEQVSQTGKLEAAYSHPPIYPGGNDAMRKFFKDNINWPEEALDVEARGKVIVNFLVNKAGIVDDIRVIGKVHDALDRELVRVIRLMPNWVPGRSNGNPIEMRFDLPFNFTDTQGAVWPTIMDLSAKEYPKNEIDLYNDGNKRMRAQLYECAEWYYTASLERKPRADAYFNRAVCRKNLANNKGYCADLYRSAEMGDLEGRKYLKQDCSQIQFTEEFLKDADRVETAPQFPGGNEALMNYIQDHLVYADSLKAQGIKGLVLVSFKIEPNGSISEVVLKNSLHPELDKVATNLIASMPSWRPGTINGKPAAMSRKLPIKFGE